ncbi:MAG: hypothetical protein H6509_01290 [Bryobacterales bacterium]|nr:hypothetical protein [Bryobacterales bacterium]
MLACASKPIAPGRMSNPSPTQIRTIDLAGALDSLRLSFGDPAPRSAQDLWRERPDVWISGKELAVKLPHLVHYTSRAALAAIRATGSIGFAAAPGVFLTPTPYAGWIAASDLGLSQPCQVALVIDAAAIEKLWGPGRARPSRTFPAFWQGGGVELYSPTPIDFRRVVQIVGCEDGHAHRIEDLP